MLLAISYIWYRAILLFIAEFKRKKVYPDFKNKVSIIVCTYNEEINLLYALLESLKSAIKSIDAEIIIGDDGSNYDVNEALLKKYKNNLDPRIKVLTFPHRGKRPTQVDCIRKSTGEVFISIDSDVLMEKNAIYELIKPFHDKKVGAVTGQIKLLNEVENWITKATTTMYWNAFNVARRSLSVFGIVNICSGALSAYRRDAFDKIGEAYLHQTFLGRRCVHGEDRALTNMVLKQGYDVVYEERAVCYTVSPSKLKPFIKQQYRWRQSTLRESFLVLKFAYKRNKLLFVETVLSLALPFMGLWVLILLIIILILAPSFILVVLKGLLIVTVIHNIFLIMEEGIYKIKDAFVYTLLTYFLLIWLWPIALINLRKEKWGTR